MNADEITDMAMAIAKALKETTSKGSTSERDVANPSCCEGRSRPAVVICMCGPDCCGA